MRPVLVFSALLALSSAACGGGAAQTGGPHNMPAYGGHEAQLFDDTIEPGAAGLELDKGLAPSEDPLLRERTQVGDAVARVKMTTVTTKNEETGTSYQIGLRTLQVLTGKNPPPAEFQVTLPNGSESSGIMKNQGQQFVEQGKTFVAFLRSYARADGEPEIHFHLAPDAADEIKAVRDAAAQQELR